MPYRHDISYKIWLIYQKVLIIRLKWQRNFSISATNQYLPKRGEEYRRKRGWRRLSSRINLCLVKGIGMIHWNGNKRINIGPQMIGSGCYSQTRVRWIVWGHMDESGYGKKEWNLERLLYWRNPEIWRWIFGALGMHALEGVVHLVEIVILLVSAFYCTIWRNICLAALNGVINQ